MIWRREYEPWDLSGARCWSFACWIVKSRSSGSSTGAVTWIVCSRRDTVCDCERPPNFGPCGAPECRRVGLLQNVITLDMAGCSHVAEFSTLWPEVGRPHFPPVCLRSTTRRQPSEG